MIGVDERIGFAQRFIALLIDVVIFAVLSFALGMVAGTFLGALVVGAASSSGMAMLGAMAGFMVAFAIVGVLYPLIEGITGWSPGKRLRGLLIGTADGDVAPTRTLLMRYAVKNSSNVVGFVGILTGIGVLGGVSTVLAVVVTIGCFMTLMAGSQALHDRIAGTAVFKADALREAAAMETVDDAIAAAQAEPAGELAETEAEPAALATDDVVEEQPVAPRPAPVRATAPAPRPRPAPTAVAPGQTRQCPKCGQNETELGKVIGWYCRICGWRESRG